MLMMNVLIFVALILISLVFQSKATLNQTDQLWDEGNHIYLYDILNDNADIISLLQAGILYLLSSIP